MSIYLGTTKIAGTTPLYNSTGSNTDGAMTQAAATNAFADTSLSNVNDTANILMSGMGMPSSSVSTTLTVGSSDTAYTAPANGWFSFGGTTSSATYAHLGIYRGSVGSKAICYGNNGTALRALLPVAKGQRITITYSSAVSNLNLQFWYAQGAESEI